MKFTRTIIPEIKKNKNIFVFLRESLFNMTREGGGGV